MTRTLLRVYTEGSDKYSSCDEGDVEVESGEEDGTRDEVGRT